MEDFKAAGFLLDYCARKLGSAESALVEAHLGHCTSCLKFVASQRALWNSLDSWEGMESSPDFNRRLYRRVEQDGQRNALVRWWSSLEARWTPLSWRPAVPAAALCAMLLAAVWIQAPAAHPSVTPEPLAKVERTDVEQVERTLQDLEMLRQLSPKVASEANPSSSI